LIGTQMVTKGLDFEYVSLVGVMSADMLMAYPDFRAAERAYQLMMQVAGRPGRIHKQGRVLIQTYQPEHRIIHHILHGSQDQFIKEELYERKAFSYPPFFRMIKISVKHKKPDVLNDAAKILATELQKSLHHRVLGPSIPYISRIRGLYILDLMIKIERSPKLLAKAKNIIHDRSLYVKSIKGLTTVRINIDVDPM
ncbi:MAG: primosomal protein N', partial [Bacteroidia bacterium]|nr:primosomal protein N' [Bacteroidia bacterium]